MKYIVDQSGTVFMVDPDGDTWNVASEMFGIPVEPTRPATELEINNAYAARAVETKKGGDMSKEYIGDGVYAADNGGGDICLTTENGISVSNIIHLGPYEARALVRYMAKLEGKDPDAAVKAVFR